jgi:hypothetical protein
MQPSRHNKDVLVSKHIGLTDTSKDKAVPVWCQAWTGAKYGRGEVWLHSFLASALYGGGMFKASFASPRAIDPFTN